MLVIRILNPSEAMYSRFALSCPLPSVTASEGDQLSAKREYIASEGFKIPMTSTSGSDYINQTKENISFSDPIDQKSSDPIDGS